MDYRRLLLTLGAQAGVFAAGALAWIAFAHGLFATASLCLLAAGFLASIGATTTFVRLGKDFLRRHGPAGATYTAELSRRRLQILLDQTPSPLLLGTGDGQLIAVNRAARRLFNVSYALPVAVKRALLGEAADITRIGGQINWQGGSWSVERTEIDESNRSSHLAVLTDISAEVRAAEATALRDLLRVLNHELMNALTPVASMSRSALDILREGEPQATAQAIKALERVVARTDGLTQFINAYRALTRLPPPDLRPVDVDPWLDVMRESFAAQWSERGVAFDIQVPAGLRAIMDEDQMWLCVGNLLNNGAQAALEKSAAEKTSPAVRLHVIAEDDRIAFRLQDSGPGIRPEQATQVFLPFYTTKDTGTGVGLSLARQIVQGHGATLRLCPDHQSEDLPGACFEFELKSAA
ncbi:MAG: HAMP domain-containing sensor histidine kinase [Asticcacaulis sp.]|uniref:sensor histidine kinase n=1 Tax=Asticcacaulis sp. TaxID=1872648 RepID=UPI0039E4EAFC